MANFIIDPNMGFANGIPGQDPGPDYANNQFSTNTTIGAHDHSAGKGVLITPNGLNINADLPINGNNVTSVKTVNFNSQLTSIPGLAPNLGCLYVAGNELVYNDENGNIVPITNNGTVNAGAGSITGLPSGTASASYSSGNKTFIWQSSTNTAANMDGGSFIFREVAANAKGVTVSSPLSLAADYQMFWPMGLPGANSFLALDNSGNISSGPLISNGLTDSNITAKSITNASITDQTITQALLAPRSSGSTVGAGGVAISGNSGLFTTSSTTPVPVTNHSVTITTTGRPVRVFFNSFNGVSNGAIFCLSSAGGGAGSFTLDAIFTIYNGLTPIYAASIALQSFQQAATAQYSQVPSSSISTIDMSVNGTPGTYTYTVGLNRQAGDNTTQAGIDSTVLMAYEI